MSATNLGNQYLTFDYKHPFKAGDFNTLLREGISPGIYNGGELAKIDDTTIEVSPFTAYLDVGSDKTIRAEARDSFEVTVSPSEPLIYITYSWLEAIENWLDFNTRAVADPPVTNEVVLGAAVYSGSTIVGIDYSDKTWGSNKKLEYIQNSIDNIIEYAGNTSDILDPSILLDSIKKGFVEGPGIGKIYWKNDDPAVNGDRLLLLQGQVIDITGMYSGILDTCYVGDANNATADAFYRTSDVGGTIRAVDGNYMVLPDTSAVGLVGTGSQTINGRVKTGPNHGQILEDQLQYHWHIVRNSDIGGGGYKANPMDTGATVTGIVDEGSGGQVEARTLITDVDNSGGAPRAGATTEINRCGTKFGITY